MSRLYLLAATLHAWTLILMLPAAFGVQIRLGELPCPLCELQRIALMLCALGPIYLLISNRRGELSFRALAISGGMSIIAGLIGAAISTRQVLLHILPGDAGYGSEVFGLHLYVWCLIAFVAHILASGLMLWGATWAKDLSPRRWRATGITIGVFVVFVLLNLASVIAEAGFNWNLPADPVKYLLFG